MAILVYLIQTTERKRKRNRHVVSQLKEDSYDQVIKKIVEKDNEEGSANRRSINANANENGRMHKSQATASSKAGQDPSAKQQIDKVTKFLEDVKKQQIEKRDADYKKMQEFQKMQYYQMGQQQ